MLFWRKEILLERQVNVLISPATDVGGSLGHAIMNYWDEYYPDGEKMVEGAKERIGGEEKPIRYINGRYKCKGERESRWLYNIDYWAEGEDLVIVEQEEEGEIRVPFKEIEYLKLRPYYYAACIGFKGFVFHIGEKAEA